MKGYSVGIGEQFEFEKTGRIEKEPNVQWYVSGKQQDTYDYRFSRESLKDNVPCAIDAAYDRWVKEGGKGTFSIMMSCSCPKCRINCGTL